MKVYEQFQQNKYDIIHGLAMDLCQKSILFLQFAEHSLFALR